MKGKFENASKNQYKFTPTFSQHVRGKQASKRGDSAGAKATAAAQAKKSINFISPDQIAK